jgi:hypothetical protein
LSPGGAHRGGRQSGHPAHDALADAHLDVRKAAVLSLTRWAGDPGARDAHADVRAYARRALEIDG